MENSLSLGVPILKHIRVVQTTLVISKSKGTSETLRHITFVELSKIPVEQPKFKNEHVL